VCLLKRNKTEKEQCARALFSKLSRGCPMVDKVRVEEQQQQQQQKPPFANNTFGTAHRQRFIKQQLLARRHASKKTSFARQNKQAETATTRQRWRSRSSNGRRCSYSARPMIAIVNEEVLPHHQLPMDASAPDELRLYSL
jgi:hypothetical protein